MISVVGTAYAEAYASTALAITPPAGTAAGDFGVLNYMTNNSATTWSSTLPAGWTAVGRGNPGTSTYSWFAYGPIAGTGTLSFASATGTIQKSGGLLVLRGVQAFDNYAGYNSLTNTGSTGVVYPLQPVTPVADDSMLIGLGAFRFANTGARDIVADGDYVNQWESVSSMSTNWGMIIQTRQLTAGAGIAWDGSGGCDYAGKTTWHLALTPSASTAPTSFRGWGLPAR